MIDRKYIAVLAIILIALCGAAGILYATAAGIGVSPDSVTYIGTARNLLNGAGLTVPQGNGANVPLTQFPPVYPIVLAVLSLPGLDPFVTARWLAALLISANILMVGSILLYLLPDQLWAAILGAFMMLLAPLMANTYVMAWSEPLFILLAISGLFLLGNHLDAPRWWRLVAASIFIGLAFLTRYAGIAYVAAGGLGILILSREKIRKRLMETIVFWMISVLPLGVVLIRNVLDRGSATNRELAFHLISRARLWEGLTTLTAWMGIPQQVPTWLHVLVLVVLFGLVSAGLIRGIRLSRTVSSQPGWRSLPGFILLLLLWLPIYGGFLLISISFIDANTPLDYRILSPMLVGLLILLLFVPGWLASKSSSPRRWMWATLIAGVLLMAAYARVTLPTLRSYNIQGIGFSSVAWRNSPLIEAVEGEPDNLIIYSNAPDAIYLLTGRRASSLPRKFELAVDQANPDFSKEVQEIGQHLLNDQGLIVFLALDGRLSNPSEADLTSLLPLTVTFQDAEGKIYRMGSGQ